VDTATGIQYMSTENIDNIDLVTTSLSVPVEVASWWTMQNNVFGAWGKINNTAENNTFKIEQFFSRFSSSQTFLLPKDISIEISGFYQTEGLFGKLRVAPFGAMNLGVQKKIQQGKGKLQLNLTDVFDTFEFNNKVVDPGPNQEIRNVYRFSNRTLKLTYSYNFGNENLKAKRTRTTGAEEELNRVE
jgi:hypothetical protein